MRCAVAAMRLVDILSKRLPLTDTPVPAKTSTSRLATATYTGEERRNEKRREEKRREEKRREEKIPWLPKVGDELAAKYHEATLESRLDYRKQSQNLSEQ
ncbi:hypothetical protein HZH66_012191 [Vespula vulgaris]|uniref:Uncharacterized protein n=1 Tax=Vespula vulgaris TaxID=7454 RepID=A0A834JBN2_VESVU|nr:hypothetical protein HZH66_012191 [Vespula vulgaris]